MLEIIIKTAAVGFCAINIMITMNYWTRRFRRKVNVALVRCKAETCKANQYMPGGGRRYTRCRTKKSSLTHYFHLRRN